VLSHDLGVKIEAVDLIETQIVLSVSYYK